MKIGESLGLETTLTDENLTYLKQLGVDDLMVGITPLGTDEPKGKSPLSGLRMDAYFAYENLVALKKWVESHGFRFYGIGLLVWPRWDKILLGKPGRDEQIEGWNKSLRNIGKAGIPLLQYNIMINEGAWIRCGEHRRTMSAGVVPESSDLTMRLPGTHPSPGWASFQIVLCGTI
jgi:D-mannonate dehydratase